MSNIEFNDFVFYSGYKKCVDSLSEQEGNLLLRAIIDYGICGKYSESTPTVNAIMANIVTNIDSSKKRYRYNVECGELGGRPKKVDYSKLAEEYYVNKKSAQNICDTYNVSERTLQRALAEHRTKFLTYDNKAVTGEVEQAAHEVKVIADEHDTNHVDDEYYDEEYEAFQKKEREKAILEYERTRKPNDFYCSFFDD